VQILQGHSHAANVTTLESALELIPTLIEDAIAAAVSDQPAAPDQVSDTYEMAQEEGELPASEDWESYYTSHTYVGRHPAAFYKLYSPGFDAFAQYTTPAIRAQWVKFILYPFDKKVLPFRQRASVSEYSVQWLINAFPGLKTKLPESLWSHGPDSLATGPVRNVLWHAAPAEQLFAVTRAYAPILKPESQWLESHMLESWGIASHSPVPVQCILDYLFRDPVGALSTVDKACTLPEEAARRIVLSKLMTLSPKCVWDLCAASFRYEFLQRTCIQNVVRPLAPGTGEATHVRNQTILMGHAKSAVLSPQFAPTMLFNLQPLAEEYLQYMNTPPENNGHAYWELMKVTSLKLTERKGIQLHYRVPDGTRINYEPELKGYAAIAAKFNIVQGLAAATPAAAAGTPYRTPGSVSDSSGSDIVTPAHSGRHGTQPRGHGFGSGAGRFHPYYGGRRSRGRGPRG